MSQTDKPAPQRLLAGILTDVQFWVPFAVLIAGLVLLKFLG